MQILTRSKLIEMLVEEKRLNHEEALAGYKADLVRFDNGRLMEEAQDMIPDMEDDPPALTDEAEDYETIFA